MKTVKKGFLWFLLLNKRLFCRASFCALLLLMPVALLLFRMAAQGEGAVVRVALAAPADAAEDTLAVMKTLTEGGGLVRCTRYADGESARRAVRDGDCDAAWLLPACLSDAVQRYAAEQTPFLIVVEREDTAAVRLARERLFGSVYPALSYALYQRAFSAPALSGIGEAEISESYHAVAVGGPLVTFEGVDFSESVDLLVSPVRGLLSLWVLLAALASGMYALGDAASGVWLRLSPRRRLLPLAAGCFCGALDAALVLLLSVWLLRQDRSPATELLSAALLAMASAALAVLLAVLCRNAVGLSLLTPPLLLLLLAASPIFLNTGRSPLFLWNPVALYLRGLTDPSFLLRSLLFSGICLLLAALLFSLFQGRDKPGKSRR